MFLVRCLNVLSSLFMAQTIDPTVTNPGAGINFGGMIGQGLGKMLNTIVGGVFYLICKWLMAFMDFLQYFIQKLIGLDYWLHTDKYTISGALKNDLLFSFLYNETVQKTFRAIVGLSIVLLIIFTIFAIVRSEWQYISGGGKSSGNFGDGQNSKATIIRNSLKAIAMVIIFPMVLMFGIISSDAILASLVKALNIDTGSTFGQAIFNVSTQNANKYRAYAGGSRYAITDEITFYIYRDNNKDKYLYLSTMDTSDDYSIGVSTYEKYVEYTAKSTKYTVNTMFEPVNPKAYDRSHTFSGYCIRLDLNGQSYYYLVADADNNPTALYYYLNNVLRVDIMTRNDNIGNNTLRSQIGTNNFKANGHITGLNIDGTAKNWQELGNAAYNTWGYLTTYMQGMAFDSSIYYVNLRAGNSYSLQISGTNGVTSSGIFTTGSDKPLMQILGFGQDTSARVMFNSETPATYFDGGQFGFVQLQSEYYVMSDVVDFIAESGMKLHIVNANSSLINWNYSTDYSAMGTAWVGKITNDGKILSTASSDVYYSNYFGVNNPNAKNSILYNKIPFIVSYSDLANDIEAGNTLYLADASSKSEKSGAVYLMCFEAPYTDAEGNQITKYVPLLNNKTYTDPISKKSYRFSSSYYTSNYKGVVIAKGIMDNSNNDYKVGFPTYIEESTTNNDLKLTDGDYYYSMEVTGSIDSYVKEGTAETSNKLTINNAIINNYTAGLSTTGDAKISIFTDEAKTTEKYIDINIIQNLSLSIGIDSNTYTATYSGITSHDDASNKDIALYQFFKDNKVFYIGVSYQNGISNEITILNYGEGGFTTAASANGFVTAIGKSYTLYYSYKGTETNAGTITSDDLKSTGKVKNGNTLFTTAEKVYISATRKYDYLSVYFTNGDGTEVTSLVTLNGTNIKFAQAGGSSNANTSAFYTFYLFDYYAGYVNGKTHDVPKPDGGMLKSNIFTCKDGSTLENASYDFDKAIMCFVDSDFSWDKDSGSYNLYNGKEYIATIYKRQGDPCSTSSEIANVSLELLYNYKTYYNIKTQNYYSSETEFKTYSDILSKSLITTFKRTNVVTEFMRGDFAFLGIFSGSVPFRINLDFGALNISRDSRFGTTIKANSGIAFDYFFDGAIELGTFYSETKISYWIIVIASILIIKTLSTAVWGIVKRFYEITLYFLAMPAVASTIPLDDGARFAQAIQRPLISKILGTYGIILGINVFFVLLTPVRSLSQVFTAEDIATSGNYFLQHLQDLWLINSPAQVAKILNNFVYILFMLVAFTMIDTLPGVVSQMVGGEDLKKTGADTKNMSKGQMASVGNTLAGTSIVNGVSKAAGAVKNSGIVRAGVGAVKGVWNTAKRIDDKFGKGKENGAVAENEAAADGKTPVDKASNKNEPDGETGDNDAPETPGEGSGDNGAGGGDNPTPAPVAGISNLSPEQVANNPELQKIQTAIDQTKEEEVSEEDSFNESETENTLKENGVSGTDGALTQGAQELSNAVVSGNATEEQKAAVTSAVSNVIENRANAESTKDSNSSLNVAVNGDGVSAHDKVSAISNSLTGKEKEEFDNQFKDANGNALTGDALAQKEKEVLKGYKFNTTTDENGNIGLQFSKLNKDGKEVKGSKTTVSAQDTAKIVGQAQAKTVENALNNNENDTADTMQSKVEAIRSAIPEAERANFDAKLKDSNGNDLQGDDLRKVLSNYQFKAGADGSLTVSEKQADGTMKEHGKVQDGLAKKLTNGTNNNAIDNVLNGANGLMKEVSTKTRAEAVRSTMTDAERQAMDAEMKDKNGNPLEGKALEQAQEKYMKDHGYSVTGTQDENGNISYAVQKKDKDGKVTSMKQVSAEAQGKIENEILKSDKISASELSSAIGSSTFAKGTIGKAVSNNLILASNDTTGNLNDTLINAVIDRDDDSAKLVKGNAMFDTLRQTDKGRKILANIMKDAGVSEEQIANDPEKKKELAKLLANTTGNSALDNYMFDRRKEYRNNILSEAKTSAQNGEIAITAYDLATAEQKQAFREKEKQKQEEKERQNPNIIAGASEEEQEGIVSNAVRKYVSVVGSNGANVKEFADEVFAASISKAELGSLSVEQLRLLTGKNDIESADDLKSSDLSKLGFIKKKLGAKALGDIDFSDESKLKDTRELYFNADERANALKDFTNAEIYAGIQSNADHKRLLVNLATSDASYAISAEQKDAIDADRAQIEEQIKKENPDISATELSSKVETELQKRYKSAANSSFDTDNPLSEKERKVSVEHSKQELKSNRDALLQVYASSPEMAERRSGDIDAGLKKIMGLDTPEKADEFVQKLIADGKLTKEQVSQLNAKGINSEGIALTYQKALLAGKFDEKEKNTDKIFASIDEMKDDSSSYDKKIIDALQAKAMNPDATQEDKDNYVKFRDSILSENNIAPAQMDKMIATAAESGILAISKDDKDKFTRKMAVDDSATSRAIKRELAISQEKEIDDESLGNAIKYNDEFRKLYKEKTGQEIDDNTDVSKLLEFYNSNKGQLSAELKTSIEDNAKTRQILSKSGISQEKMNKMSEVELNSRLDIEASKIITDDDLHKLVDSDDSDVIGRTLRKNKGLKSKIDKKVSESTYEEVAAALLIDNEVDETTLVAEARKDQNLLSKVKEDMVTVSDDEVLSLAKKDKDFKERFENFTNGNVKLENASQEDLMKFLDSSDASDLKQKFVKTKKDEKAQAIKDEDVANSDIRAYLDKNQDKKSSLELMVKASGGSISKIEKQASDEEISNTFDEVETKANDYTKIIANKDKDFINFVIQQEAKSQNQSVEKIRENFDINKVKEEDYSKYFEMYSNNEKTAKSAKNIRKTAKNLMILARNKKIDVDTDEGKKELEKLSNGNLEESVVDEALKANKENNLTEQDNEKVKAETIKLNSEFKKYVNQKGKELSDLSDFEILKEFENFSSGGQNSEATKVINENIEKVTYLAQTSGFESGSEKMQSYIEKVSGFSKEEFNKAIQEREFTRILTVSEKEAYTTQAVTERRAKSELEKELTNDSSTVSKEVRAYAEINDKKYKNFLKENNLEENNESLAKFYVSESYKNDENFKKTSKDARDIVDMEINTQSFLALSPKIKKKYTHFLSQTKLKDSKLGMLRFYQAQNMHGNSMLEKANKLAGVKKGEVEGTKIAAFASLRADEFNDFVKQSNEKEFNKFKYNKEYNEFASLKANKGKTQEKLTKDFEVYKKNKDAQEFETFINLAENKGKSAEVLEKEFKDKQDAPYKAEFAKLEGKDLDLLKVEFYEDAQKKISSEDTSKVDKKRLQASMNSAETMTNIKKSTKLGEEINSFVSSEENKVKYAKFAKKYKDNYGENVDEDIIKTEFYNSHKHKFKKISKNFEPTSQATLEGLKETEKQVHAAGQSAREFFKNKGLTLERTSVVNKISDEDLDAQILKDAEEHGIIIKDETVENKALLSSSKDAVFKAYSEYEDINDDVTNEAVKAYYGITSQNVDAMANEVKQKIDGWTLNNLIGKGITTNEQLVLAYKKVELAGRGKSKRELQTELLKTTNYSDSKVINKEALQVIQEKGTNAGADAKEVEKYNNAKVALNKAVEQSDIKSDVIDAAMSSSEFKMDEYKNKFGLSSESSDGSTSNTTGKTAENETAEQLKVRENAQLIASNSNSQFVAYSNSLNRDDSVVNEVVKAYAGIDKSNEKHYIENKLNKKTLSTLESNYSSEQIAVAYAKAEVLGLTKNKNGKDLKDSEIAKVIEENIRNTNDSKVLQTMAEKATSKNASEEQKSRYDAAKLKLDESLDINQKTELVDEATLSATKTLTESQNNSLQASVAKDILLSGTEESVKLMEQLKKDNIVQNVNVGDSTIERIAKSNPEFMKKFNRDRAADEEYDVVKFFNNHFFDEKLKHQIFVQAEAETFAKSIDSSTLSTKLQDINKNSEAYTNLQNKVKETSYADISKILNINNTADDSFITKYSKTYKKFDNVTKDGTTIDGKEVQFNVYSNSSMIDNKVTNDIVKAYTGLDSSENVNKTIEELNNKNFNINELIELGKNNGLTNSEDVAVAYQKALLSGKITQNSTKEEITKAIVNANSAESNKLALKSMKTGSGNFNKAKEVLDNELLINQKTSLVRRFEQDGSLALTDAQKTQKLLEKASSIQTNNGSSNIVEDTRKAIEREKLANSTTKEEREDLFKSQILRETLLGNDTFIEEFRKAHADRINVDKQDLTDKELVEFYKQRQKIDENEDGLFIQRTQDIFDIKNEFKRKLKEYKTSNNDEKLDKVLAIKKSQNVEYKVTDEEVAQKLISTTNEELKEKIDNLNKEISTETLKENVGSVVSENVEKEVVKTDYEISKEAISNNEELQYMAYANSIKTIKHQSDEKTTNIVDNAVKVYAGLTQESQVKSKYEQFKQEFSTEDNKLETIEGYYTQSDIMVAYTKAKLAGKTVDENGNELKGSALENVIIETIENSINSRKEANSLNSLVMQNIQNNATKVDATENDIRAYNRVKNYVNSSLTEDEKNTIIERAAKNGQSALTSEQTSELGYEIAKNNEKISNSIKREKLLTSATENVSESELEERKIANLIALKGNTTKEITKKDEEKAEYIAKAQFALKDNLVVEIAKNNETFKTEFAKENAGKDVNTAAKEEINNFYQKFIQNTNSNDKAIKSAIDELNSQLNKKFDDIAKNSKDIDGELDKTASEQDIKFSKEEFEKYSSAHTDTREFVNKEINKMSYNQISQTIDLPEVNVEKTDFTKVKTRDEIIAEYRSNPELMDRVKQSYAKENNIVLDEVREKALKVTDEDVSNEILTGDSKTSNDIKDEIIKNRAENKRLISDTEVINAVRNGKTEDSKDVLKEITKNKKDEIERDARKQTNQLQSDKNRKDQFDNDLTSLINQYNNATDENGKATAEASIKTLLSNNPNLLDSVSLANNANNVELIKRLYGDDKTFETNKNVNVKTILEEKITAINDAKNEQLKNVEISDDEIKVYLAGHENQKKNIQAEISKDNYNDKPVTKKEVDKYLKDHLDQKEQVRKEVRQKRNSTFVETTASQELPTTSSLTTTGKRYKSMQEIRKEIRERAEREEMVDAVYKAEGNLISVEQIQTSLSNEKEKGAGERAKKFFSRLFAGSGNADDINLSDVSTRTLDEKTKKNILEKAKADSSLKLTDEELKQSEDTALTTYVNKKFAREIENAYNAELALAADNANAGIFTPIKSRAEIEKEYIAKLDKGERNKVVSEAKDDTLISKYIAENESALYDAKNETQAEAVLEKTKQMAMGIDGTNAIIADFARSDKRQYQKIVTEFQKTHQGVEFSELDVTEQNKYLASKYENNVSDEVVQNKYLETLISKGVITTSDGKTSLKNANGDIDQDAFKQLKNNILREKGNMTMEQYFASGKADKYLNEDNRRETIEKLANRNDGSLEQRAIKNMDGSIFNSLHKKITSDLTDETSSVFEEEKRAIVEAKVDQRYSDGKINPTTVIPNVSEMDEKEAREFSTTKIMLSNQVRENTRPDILKNILNNTNLVNEDQILRELAKAQNIDKSLYENEDGTINKTKLMSMLDNETVNNYFNKNIEMRETMLSIGAKDLTTTLTAEQRAQKDLEAINGNENLKNQMLLETIKSDNININAVVLRYSRRKTSLSSGEKNDIEREVRNSLKRELMDEMRKSDAKYQKMTDSELSKKISDKDLDKFIREKQVSDDEINSQILTLSERNSISSQVRSENAGKSETEINNLITQAMQDKSNQKLAEIAGIDIDGLSSGEIANKISTLKSSGKLTNGMLNQKLAVYNKQSEVVERKLAQQYDMYTAVTNNQINEALDINKENEGARYKKIASEFGISTKKETLTKEELNQALVSEDRRKEIETQVRTENFEKSDDEIAKLVKSKVEIEANEKISKKYNISAGMKTVDRALLNRTIFAETMKNRDEVLLQIAKEEYTDKNGNIKDSAKAKVSKKIEEEKNSKHLPNFRENLYKEVRNNISYTKDMTEEQLTQFLETQEIQKTDDLSFKNYGKGLANSLGEFFTGALTTVGGVPQAIGHKFKGALYHVIRRTPENSSSYNNWNIAIQRQIAEVKRGEGSYGGLSAQERQDKINELSNKLIFTNKSLPRNFAQMNPEQKRAWKANQTKLKVEAFNTKDFNYIKHKNKNLKDTKVGRQSFVDNFGYKFGFQGTNVSAGVKEQHKKDLSIVKAKITEYNATKGSMNFGSYSEFSALAKKYLGDTRATDRIINNGKEMSASERQKALEEAIAKKYKIASHRVAHDNGVKRKDFLEERGIGNTVVRYKDATKKYTALKSRINTHIPIPGLNKLVNGAMYGVKKFIVDDYDRRMVKNDGKVNPITRALYNRVYGKRYGDAKAQALARKNNLELGIKQIEKLNLNFKGTSAEYAKEIEKILGPVATKVYDSGTRLYNRNSAVSIQKNGVLKTLNKLVLKENRRLGLNSNIIPAGDEATSEFIGKEFKNARSASQKENDKRIAEEYNNALNLVMNQRSVSSYDAVMARLLPQVREQVENKFGHSLDKKTDSQKFDELQKYLLKQLTKANNRVYNNSMIRTGNEELQKINGLVFKTSDLKKSKISGTMVDAVMNSDARYKEIMKKYESDRSRYLTEKQNRENLLAEFNKFDSMPRNSYTKTELQRVNEAIAESNIRLKVLKNNLNKSEGMKKTFELTYAKNQIESARKANAVPAMKMAGIFDSYNVFADVMGPDGRPMMGPHGRPMRRPIYPHSPEARHLEMMSRRFMNDYKVQIFRMKFALRNQRYVDYEMKKELDRISRKVDGKFSDRITSMRTLMNTMDRKIAKLSTTRNRDQLEYRNTLIEQRARLDRIKMQLVTSMNEKNYKLEEKVSLKDKESQIRDDKLMNKVSSNSTKIGQNQVSRLNPNVTPKRVRLINSNNAPRAFASPSVDKSTDPTNKD